MKERMNALKTNRKKGFTLVEVIVVLVILAILAALLIPALTGYIDKANEKQITAETRSAVMAAQTIVDEKYAENPTVTIDDALKAEIKTLAEVEGTINSVTVADGKVTNLEYASGGKTCAYDHDGKDASDNAIDKYTIS